MGNIVSNTEIVSRILKRDWFDDGKLMHVAFALRKGESYISVNRLSVDSYEKDVLVFIRNHPAYAFDENLKEYCSANLNVKDVRAIHVTLDEESLDIDVDVEPRAHSVKSHAGIFTRYGNANLKPGELVYISKNNENIAADAILLKMRLELLHIAQCQQKKVVN